MGMQAELRKAVREAVEEALLQHQKIRIIVVWDGDAPAPHAFASDDIQLFELTKMGTSNELPQFTPEGMYCPPWTIPWESVLGIWRAGEVVLMHPLLSPANNAVPQKPEKTDDTSLSRPPSDHRGAPRNIGTKPLATEPEHANVIVVDFSRRSRR